MVRLSGVEGQIYVGDEEGNIVVFRMDRILTVLAVIDMEAPITLSPVVANGVLYLATTNKLYAIASR